MTFFVGVPVLGGFGLVLWAVSVWADLGFVLVSMAAAWAGMALRIRKRPWMAVATSTVLTFASFVVGLGLVTYTAPCERVQWPPDGPASGFVAFDPHGPCDENAFLTWESLPSVLALSWAGLGFAAWWAYAALLPGPTWRRKS